MNYNKEYFDNQFTNYNTKYGNGWGMNWRAYMKLRILPALDEVLKYISAHDKCTILEIGCASGDFTNSYIDVTKAEQKIIGADISELAVDICKKRFETYENATFVKMALPNVEIQDINCIICMDVLEYFDEPGKRQCLLAMKEALNNSGEIICQLPLGNEDERAFRELFSKIFKIKTECYVYGRIWYKCFEELLVLLVNVFLIGNRWGGVGKAIGKLAYKICNSDKLVTFWFKVNEKFFPSKKSHVILVGEI